MAESRAQDDEQFGQKGVQSMSNHNCNPVHELMRAEVRSMNLDRLLTDTLHLLHGLLLMCLSSDGKTARKAIELVRAKIRAMPGAYRVARHLAELDASFGYPLEGNGLHLACWISERLKGAKKQQAK